MGGRPITNVFLPKAVVGRGFEPLSVTGKGNRPEPLDEPTKSIF